MTVLVAGVESTEIAVQTITGLPGETKSEDGRFLCDDNE